MCRPGTEVCSELGASPDRWSRLAPLPPPQWFETELDQLVETVRAAKSGERDRARDLLRNVRGDEMREWYLAHGQNSGCFRHRHLGKPAATPLGPPVEVNKTPSKTQEAQVLSRDGYRCRYCGLRLISCDVLKLMERLLGSDVFPATKKNASHGAALVFRCSVDHVDPLKLGGTTSLPNLVAACYSCNFGKWNYSLAQIGLEDPRNRPPVPINGWDGLMSVVG